MAYLRGAIAVGMVLTTGCALFGMGKSRKQAEAAVAQAEAANAAKFEHSPADRDAFIAQYTEGYQPVSEPIEGTLETFEPVPIQLERGQCYVMVLRLADGGAFSADAKQGLSWAYQLASGREFDGGPGVHGPGGAASAGCPFEDTTGTFALRPDVVADATLGHGAYELVWMSKPIAEEELVAMEEEDAARDAAAAEKAAARAKDACDRCREEYLSCLRGGGKTCDDKEASCLRLRGDVQSRNECY